MRIIEAVKDDAEELLKMFNTLDSETEFMLYEPNERITTVRQQEDIITDFIGTPSKKMLLAINESSEEIAGFTVGIGYELTRNKHTLYSVIGVKRQFSGQGIGKQLLQQLELWAKNKNFHRIELTVMEHNERAIKLYKACGYEPEGVKRDSIIINDRYINELYMSKLI